MREGDYQVPEAYGQRASEHESDEDERELGSPTDLGRYTSGRSQMSAMDSATGATVHRGVPQRNRSGPALATQALGRTRRGAGR